MKGFYAVLSTEILKSSKSKMLWISVLLFIFMGLMIGLLMLISKHPEIAGKSVVINTKASLIGKADWPTYLKLLIQMVLTIGSIGSGIVTIWVFGREYTDRVIKDLLALPVSRKVFVLSKFIIIVVWSILLLLLLFLTALIAGLLADLDSWSPALIKNYFILYIVSAFLTVLLCSPVALITCLSRGYLLPVAFVFLTLIMTQFVYAAIPSIITYFPWAIPALFSGVAGSDMPHPGIISYSVLIITSVAGYIGTAAWWRYADQR
jgi:ABC-2 type transport system permease protein